MFKSLFLPRVAECIYVAGDNKKMIPNKIIYSGKFRFTAYFAYLKTIKYGSREINQTIIEHLQGFPQVFSQTTQNEMFYCILNPFEEGYFQNLSLKEKGK